PAVIYAARRAGAPEALLREEARGPEAHRAGDDAVRKRLAAEVQHAHRPVVLLALLVDARVERLRTLTQRREGAARRELRVVGGELEQRRGRGAMRIVCGGECGDVRAAGGGDHGAARGRNALERDAL